MFFSGHLSNFFPLMIKETDLIWTKWFLCLAKTRTFGQFIQGCRLMCKNCLLDFLRGRTTPPERRCIETRLGQDKNNSKVPKDTPLDPEITY